MKVKHWMLYGANGYTGELIARKAISLGMRPLLAGRNAEKIQALAEELDLPARVFPLENVDQAAVQLGDIAVVLHCAGPFSKTGPPMIAACLKSHTHYLDITGEIDIFEHAYSLHKAAKKNEVVLCPGVGFDVIPTDCLASLLKTIMPRAKKLTLGFDSRSSMSTGTARTSVEGLAAGGRIRKDGRITKVPLAHTTRRIDFGNGEKLAIPIPWGDVSTAYFTTGIPNIEVYVPAPTTSNIRLRLFRYLRPFLLLPGVRSLLKYQIGKQVTGPDSDTRAATDTWVWGEVVDKAGTTRVARFKTANGYDVTVDGAIGAVQKLIDDPPESGGYYTPSQLLGHHFAGNLPGSSEVEILQGSPAEELL